MNNAAYIYEDTLQKSLFHTMWCGLCRCESESTTVQSTADVTTMTDLWASQESLWKISAAGRKKSRTCFFFPDRVRIICGDITPTNSGHASFSDTKLHGLFIKWKFFQSCIFVFFFAILDQRWFKASTWRVIHHRCGWASSSVTDSNCTQSSPTWELYRSPDDYLQPLKQRSKSKDILIALKSPKSTASLMSLHQILKLAIKHRCSWHVFSKRPDRWFLTAMRPKEQGFYKCVNTPSD